MVATYLLFMLSYSRVRHWKCAVVVVLKGFVQLFTKKYIWILKCFCIEFNAICVIRKTNAIFMHNLSKNSFKTTMSESYSSFRRSCVSFFSDIWQLIVLCSIVTWIQSLTISNSIKADEIRKITCQNALVSSFYSMYSTSRCHIDLTSVIWLNILPSWAR